MEIIINILRGVAIGLANIIPGVSGGTMALVLGIYERLLGALSAFGPQTIKACKGGWQSIQNELKRTDVVFLGSLGIGAGIAIVAAARVMTNLLENQHDPTFGFFFGLVLASIVVPYQLIRRINLTGIISAILAAALVVGLTLAMSGEDRLEAARKKAAIKSQTTVTLAPGVISPESTDRIPVDTRNMLFFFVAGAIAISAMILPGISGSFMLLLMGVYFDILICINERQIILLACFALGCLGGLLLFTRFLNYLLKNFHDTTMSFLLGLVGGSLYAIWPFKSFDFADGRRVDIANIIPQTFGTNEMLTLGTTIAGCAIVAMFILIEKKKKPESL